MTRFDFPPRRVFRLLLVLIAVMLVLHFVSVALVARAGGLEGVAWWAYTYLNLDSEDSIPTAYSVVMLALVAIVAAQLMLSTRGTQRAGWGLIALVFALISWDEGATIHETVGYQLQQRIEGIERVNPYSWVLVGAPLAILFGIVAIGLLRSLPLGVLLRMVAAGVIFLTGAAGLEFQAGALFDTGRDGMTPLMLSLSGVEELFEMLGVALFFRVLLDYRAAVEEAAGIRVVRDLQDVSEGAAGRSYRRRRDLAAGSRDGASVA